MQKIPIKETSQTNTHRQIKSNVSLSDKNWFGTGGPAQYYVEPETYECFQDALIFARENNLPLFVLGSGANILISDDGFNGLVIKPKFDIIELVNETSDEAYIAAGTGVLFDDLILFCLRNNLIGLEEFSGIPGTVGGSLYINIHYFQFLLSSFLVSAEVIDKKTGTILNVEPSWFNFGYNQSTLQEKEYYLLSATLRVKKADTHAVAFARGRYQEIIRHRQNRYPLKGTCGSFFRNFLDHEVSLYTAQGKKLIYVAYYLDNLGIKGALSVGDAIVSHQHANMIVNKGNATTEDIITLARIMQQKVHEKFNLIPQPECQLIGFQSYPLL